jgi:hypothetical protein
MEFLIVMLILVAFSLAAWRWGYDSRGVAPDVNWKRHSVMNSMTRYHHL